MLIVLEKYIKPENDDGGLFHTTDDEDDGVEMTQVRDPKRQRVAPKDTDIVIDLID